MNEPREGIWDDGGRQFPVPPPPARKGDWLQVYTGGNFYPFDPRPEEIHIEDIAHSLALQSRFGGHCRVFYCPTLDQRILTSDLRWVPAGELRIGSELLAFDEHPWEPGSTGRRRRRFRHSVVTHSEPMQRPVGRLQMADGRVVKCSLEHPWLVATKSSGNQKWVTTSDLIRDLGKGRKRYMHRFMDVWDECPTWKSGWVAGLIDGEGYLSTNNRKGVQFGVSQLPGLVLDNAASILSDHNFRALRYNPTGEKSSGVLTLKLSGGWREIARLLGTVRPVRLLEKFQKSLRMGQFSKQMDGKGDPEEIVAAKEDGTDWVMGLSTSTHTYLCEGYGAHNSTAEHSVRCSYVGPEEEALWRLLHDGSEAYMVDLPRPIKRHPDLFRYRAQEQVNQHAIFLRFGLPSGFDAWGNVWMPESVKIADEILLATEARDLMGNAALERWSSLKDVQPLPEVIEPWTWQEAEARFLARFRELT